MSALISCEVLRRSFRTSTVVGAVLVVVNHFNILQGAEVTLERLIQVLLCFLVPLAVSLYSQISIIRRYHEQRQPELGRPEQ